MLLARNTYFNYLKNFRSQEGKQMLACNSQRVYSYSYSIYTVAMGQLLNGQLAELLTIFRYLYTGIAKTTSTSIARCWVVGRGWQGATKWQINAASELKTVKWNWLLIQLPIPKAKSLANLISQSCGDLQSAVYLRREDGAF